MLPAWLYCMCIVHYVTTTHFKNQILTSVNRRRIHNKVNKMTKKEKYREIYKPLNATEIICYTSM